MNAWHRLGLLALSSGCFVAAVACGGAEDTSSAGKFGPGPSTDAGGSNGGQLDRDAGQVTGDDDDGDGDDIPIVTEDAGPAPPDPSLVLHYTFDADEGTTVVDSSPAGNDGRRVGATPVAGRVGSGALAFNGTSNYVVGGPVGALGSAWTVAMWFKTEEFAFGRSLFEANWTDNFSNPSSGLTLTMSPNGGGLVGMNLGTSSSLISFTALNEWHHVVVTVSGLQVTAYYDGKQSFSRTSDKALPTTFANVQIARGTAPGATGSSPYFKGQLDDVRVYERALAAAEVTTLFDGAK